MTFLPEALDSGTLDTLRGTDELASTFAGRVRISTCPNTVVYSARVNQSVFATSFAQITFDGGSGTLADIWPGMRVLASHSNDKTKAFFTGRVRKTPTSSILYINESSASFADNDYLWVIDDFPIADKLGREVAKVLYMDYDIAFRQLRPVIYNLKSAYVDDIDVDTEVITISFAPLALAATSGATIPNWAWDVGDGTITVGSDTTQNITATFPEGHRWVHLTVTDSGGRSSTRHIPVWAHGDSYVPALNASDSIQVTGDVGSGYDATITAFDGVSGLLNNSLIVMWGKDDYQDHSGSITGDNILFMGRIRKGTAGVHTSEDSGPDSDIGYTLESPLTQLARIEQLPYEMLNKSSPTKWGHVKNMTIWRGIVLLLSEASTFLDLHSLTFSDTSDAFLAPTHNISSSVLDSMNDLALSINAAFQMNASGSAEIVRDAVMLDYDPDNPDERDDLITVATWTESDLADIVSHEHEHVRTIGRLKAAGGSYKSSTNLFRGYRSLAPGIAQESGQGSGNLDKQILTANQTKAFSKAELAKRAGHAFEKEQPPEVLTLVFMDGYHGVLIPCRNMWHCFDLQPTETFAGVSPDIRWLLVNVQVAHYNDGTKQVTAKFISETHGAPGQDITQPPETGTPAPYPLTPPFEINPALGGGLEWIMPPFSPISPIISPDTKPRIDGNTVGVFTDTDLWLTYNFLIGSHPDYNSIHPEPGAAIRAFMWYPWTINNKGALALVGDDSTTAVYRVENVFANSPKWIAGAAMTGVYNRLRAVPELPGALYAAGNQVSDGANCDLDNWYASAGTITSRTSTTITMEPEIIEGTYIVELRSPGTNVGCIAGGYVDTSGVAPVIQWDLSGESYPGSFPGSNLNHGGLYPTGQCLNAIRYYGFLGGAFTSIVFTFAADDGCGDPSPLAAGQSRYSTDYGAGMEDAVSVAAVPLGGFDVSRKGAQVLAGGGTQTRKSTTGGSYADYGDPVPSPGGANAIFIPRFNFGSTSSSNSGSTPQYLLASGALSDDDEALWKVLSSGTDYADITPTVGGDIGKATGPECLAMPWINGNIIAAILMFDDLPRLVVSRDGGSTWANSATLDITANYLRMRKNDTAKKQAFLTNDGPAFCPNIQAAAPKIYTRDHPSDDTIIGIEVFGG